VSDKLGPYDLDTIVTGDARELAKAVPDGSVDCIFTDPPYIKKHIALYGWLAEFGARVLKPDGFLCAYVGVYWKDDVMAMIRPYMRYWFDMVLLNPGNSPVMWNKNVISRYKSLLVYTLPDADHIKARVMALSWFEGGGQDKRYHTWGQDESTARYYIDCLTYPDAVILDPFEGGGTTAYVCRQLGRSHVGFEIDPATADTARARQAEVQHFLFVDMPQQMSFEDTP
jgi:DNA modification methylase